MNIAFAHDRLAQAMLARQDSPGLAELRAKLDGLAITVSIEPAVAEEPWAQAAAMAIVATGSRMFRGGVFLPAAPLSVGALFPGLGHPFHRVLERLGARATGTAPMDALHVHIGFEKRGDINAAVRGWTAIVSPRAINAAAVPSNVITGVLAGAIAVSESFRRLALGAANACRVTQELNAWEPGSSLEIDGTIKRLPKALWLIGLGNLGQAALFILSLLPFRDRSEVTLFLQDFDRSGPENLGTQILTDYSWIGHRKAAAASAHLRALGFETFAIERRFVDNHGPLDDEPKIAIVGVDNAKARRSAAAAGFDFVLDAGLGTTPAEIFDLALHVFPGTCDPQSLWPDPPVQRESQALPERYEKLVEAGVIDRCGAVTIAGQPVGVPSTALAAAALQLAQLCRALSTRSYCDSIDVRTARTAHATSTRINDHALNLAPLMPAER